jgi:hypothetical protein
MKKIVLTYPLPFTAMDPKGLLGSNLSIHLAIPF